jgi:tryptophanyl-tRNA synthetase
MSDVTARVLSGVQPTGDLHLGNYFGAIKQHIELQDRYPGESYYFIADYLALTTVHDGAALRKSVFEAAVAYLALGLDPDKALIFRQSDVAGHTDLAWMLACVTGMGLLERAHSYKDKLAKGIKPSSGLFFYPVLMAADILIYGASLVPVGKDQVQHVEMAQDMATHFNQAFCPESPVLRRPEFQLSKTPKVPGLDGEKMSKSYGNDIKWFESGKQLKKRVGQIVTDSTPLGQPLPTQSCNVLGLLEPFCDEDELEQIRGYYRTGVRDGAPFGYGHAKQLLASKIDAYFAEARARREHLLAHPAEVEAVLQRSAKRAGEVARVTIDACRRVTGFN